MTSHQVVVRCERIQKILRKIFLAVRAHLYAPKLVPIKLFRGRAEG
jgi:hypothetical protein